MLIFKVCTHDFLLNSFVRLLLFDMIGSERRLNLGILETIVEFLVKHKEMY